MIDSEQSLAQRLLAGDRRSLARAISLVEADDPRGWALVREIYPHTGRAEVIGFTGPPGVGKSTLLGALTRLERDREVSVGGALDRSVVPVHPRRAARRPDSADRSLPRSRRVHPLDGQPRRARRPQRSGAPGRAADGRRRTRGDPARDGRRRPGRGRHHRPRRHGRVGADARLGRFDSGAQGRRDGDPRRDRHQQGRPPPDRHDDPRDQGRARARPARGMAGADRPHRGGARRGGAPSCWRSSPSTAPTSRPRARCPSVGAATC